MMPTVTDHVKAFEQAAHAEGWRVSHAQARTFVRMGIEAITEHARCSEQELWDSLDPAASAEKARDTIYRAHPIYGGALLNVITMRLELSCDDPLPVSGSRRDVSELLGAILEVARLDEPWAHEYGVSHHVVETAHVLLVSLFKSGETCVVPKGALERSWRLLTLLSAALDAGWAPGVAFAGPEVSGEFARALADSLTQRFDALARMQAAAGSTDGPTPA